MVAIIAVPAVLVASYYGYKYVKKKIDLKKIEKGALELSNMKMSEDKVLEKVKPETEKPLEATAEKPSNSTSLKGNLINPVASVEEVKPTDKVVDKKGTV